MPVTPSTARLHMSKPKSEMAMTPPAAITGGRQVVGSGVAIDQVVRRGWLLDWRREAG